METRRLTIALAGNPNSGKTTIFNAITGARQHVGNYPGVTVEKKEGSAQHQGVKLHVVDLPGTYSLTAYSVEEIVARNFILNEKPDVVVDIVDSANLERNLYLATQLMELGVPLILAFNMADIAESRGYRIHTRRLSQLLGVPIVRTVGNKSRGIDRVLDEVLAVGSDPVEAAGRQRQIRYGGEVEPHVRQLAGLLGSRCRLGGHERWFAVKLLEDDEEAARLLGELCGEHVEEILGEAGRLRNHIQGVCGDSAEIILADRRYGFISGACTEAVRQTVETRHERSDQIDWIMTNRYLGGPIFAAMMYLVFQMTFWIGNPLVELLDGGKEALAGAVRSVGEPDRFVLVKSLLADGIIEGVGVVLTFVPLIALLYLAIAILEDTGYMARAAFVLDRLMHRIGLHGKSFIPMLIGFGCTVPAIMATRTLESRRDRLTTMLVLPLMSCGARLPIYVLIIAAFFRPHAALRVFGFLEITNQGLLLFVIYAIGILLGLVCTKVLRATIFRGEVTPFVMELPPYRMPTPRGLLLHTWERTWLYLKKAGTIILAIVIVLWAMRTFPTLPERQRTEVTRRAAEQGRDPALDAHRAELAHSAIGRIGQGVAPVLAPCGFDWKISTALLGSFAAKEVFISQMGIIHAVSEDAGAGSKTLRERLAANYTALQGFCIMLFILISSPCMATVAVTIRESGSWKWALLQWTYLTALAWMVTAIVYQAGMLLT